MFRLIKLAMLALFGYVVYEFFRGIAQGTEVGARLGDAMNRIAQGQQQGGGGAGGGGQAALGGAGEQARAMNMTGPGEGMTESTLERDGGSVAHQVGRGVIS